MPRFCHSRAKLRCTRSAPPPLRSLNKMAIFLPFKDTVTNEPPVSSMHSLSCFGTQPMIERATDLLRQQPDVARERRDHLAAQFGRGHAYARRGAVPCLEAV